MAWRCGVFVGSGKLMSRTFESFRFSPLAELATIDSGQAVGEIGSSDSCLFEKVLLA